MPDLRAFVAVDWNDNLSVHGPWDFERVPDDDVADRDMYYEALDSCEGHSGEQVIELIKRPNGKWEHIGPHE